MVNSVSAGPLDVTQSENLVRSRTYVIAKRVLDFLISLLTVICMSPIMVAIGIAIRLDSPGPVLFRSQRLGQWGRPFFIYKFRTMVGFSESLSRDAVTGPIYKMRCDPRVTRVGRFLRRSSLDELPQLLNVLRGEMSLVGPRPALMFEVGLVDSETALRLQVKPGITGLWQAGRSYSPSEIVTLDDEYVRQASLWTDCRILIETVWALVKGRGAY